MALDEKKTEKRAELRSFLMARRAAITPAAAGLPGGSRRRTPGLRREELAALAGIGVTWYTWLEQGRAVQVSAATLERVATALRLTPSDADYLFALCGVRRFEDAGNGSDVVDRCVQNMLDAIAGAPAFVWTPRGNVIAYNRLADLIFEFEAYDGPHARNHHWRFFMDPNRRAKYLDWEALAKIYVSWLRLQHGKLADDPYFDGLIRQLRDECAEFRRLWDAQYTERLADTVRIAFTLPKIGPLYFDSVRLQLQQAQQGLIVLPPADEATALAVRKLAAPRAPVARKPRRVR
jgi:transcriptional regulator with XRE-family HTH domain